MSKHFEGEIDMKDFDGFKGYLLVPCFSYYQDYEGDWDIYFDTLEHAQYAMNHIEEVYNVRGLSEDEKYTYELKENEDFVVFQIFECSDGCGKCLKEYDSRTMIIELY